MTADELIDAKRAYYAKPGNSAGGLLHFILDDGNMEDEWLRQAVKRCRRMKDVDGQRIAEGLLTLSDGAREKVYLA
jgi:hypothetical protein